jgi:hypothetical protein
MKEQGLSNAAERPEHEIRDLIPFFLLAFGTAWVLWLPFVLPGLGAYRMTDTLESLMTPAVMLGAFGPALAAVTVTARRGGWLAARSFLKEGISLKAPFRFYAYALLLPTGVTAGAHYLANGLGVDNLPSSLLPSDLPIPTFLVLIPNLVLMLFLGGGQEEFGWRGYAQVPLQRLLGFVPGTLVLGAIWGIWHLPLWFMPGEGHAYYPFAAFVLYTISLSLVMGWLYEASGNKLIIPWLTHAMSNAVIPFFPILHLEDVQQPGYILWVTLNALAAVIIASWYGRKRAARIRRETDLDLEPPSPPEA